MVEEISMKKYKIDLIEGFNGRYETGSDMVEITCDKLIRDRMNNKVLYADGVKLQFSMVIGNIEVGD
jgi:hypothetical protein